MRGTTVHSRIPQAKVKALTGPFLLCLALALACTIAFACIAPAHHAFAEEQTEDIPLAEEFQPLLEPIDQPIEEEETPLAQKPESSTWVIICAGIAGTIAIASAPILYCRRYANILDDYEDQALNS